MHCCTPTREAVAMTFCNVILLMHLSITQVKLYASAVFGNIHSDFTFHVNKNLANQLQPLCLKIP